MGKYSLQTKLLAVEDYCSGQSGLKAVAHRHNVDVSSLRQWIASYREHGADGLRKKSRNFYSVEFKLAVLKRMQDDDLSCRQAAALFDIRRFDIIGHWKRQYDEGGVQALSWGSSGKHKTMNKQHGQDDEPPARNDDTLTRQQLVNELKRLRMENAYLKKLKALTQASKPTTPRTK
jgi:transposase